MKFGKRLKHQIQETLPEWRDHFLSYKNLKKLVRLISSTSSTKAEADFIDFLNSEIDKFNAFFMEQEEDFIIRRKELQERIQRVEATVGPSGSRPSQTIHREEMGRIRKEIVNFYGEMVLLENYSNINYTGITKILKKYDKRTGGSMRLLFIQNVLTQPFFTTALISKLIKECENTMDAVFAFSVELSEEEREKLEREATMLAEQTIFRSTVAALATMREMRSSSSTYSSFSLPPMDLLDSDIIQSFQLHSPIPIL